MANFRFGPWPSSRRLVLALVISLLPLGTAFAQSGPRVRVTNDDTEITARLDGKGDVVMRAAVGTVLTVIDTEGDRYAHRRSNWYLVLLPRDEWGTQRGGWISGRDVDYVPPTERQRPAAAETVIITSQPMQSTVSEQSSIARAAEQFRPPAPAASPVSSASPSATTSAATPNSAARPPAMAEVTLNFEFDKSNLTNEAKVRLAAAATTMKTNGQGVSFLLEGHADSTGPEPYNERLGLARAESVKRYLAEQHEIPLDKMSVVSYGETKPSVSNATREGRAQNRRVVVKVGG